jgi:hypothetical protein
LWGYEYKLLRKSDRQQYLDTLLSTYNLVGTVNFPTRIDKNSKTATDNVCIHVTGIYTINPIMNGLSDHDAQTIMNYDIMTSGSFCSSKCFRNYNNHNILKFKELLSNERWDDVFANNDVNSMFSYTIGSIVKSGSGISV